MCFFLSPRIYRWNTHRHVKPDDCLFLCATILDLPVRVLFSYEPPRPGARKIVFTLFKARQYEDITLPSSRENFSTRAFVQTNSVADPLAAAFFKIKYENGETQESDSSEPSKSISAPSHNKCEENGSTSKRKKFRKD